MEGKCTPPAYGGKKRIFKIAPTPHYIHIIYYFLGIPTLPMYKWKVHMWCYGMIFHHGFRLLLERQTPWSEGKVTKEREEQLGTHSISIGISIIFLGNCHYSSSPPSSTTSSSLKHGAILLLFHHHDHLLLALLPCCPCASETLVWIVLTLLAIIYTF